MTPSIIFWAAVLIDARPAELHSIHRTREGCEVVAKTHWDSRCLPVITDDVELARRQLYSLGMILDDNTDYRSR